MLLSHIARTRFEPDVVYTEGQVNRRLAEIFDDYVALRRYLVEAGRLDRTPDGARYWLPGAEQPIGSYAAVERTSESARARLCRE